MNSEKHIDRQNIAEFLRTNPDIFQQHPELLTLINLSDGRGTSSLLERQITRLKDQLREFKSAQHDLFAVARENEQISDDFALIILKLIGFTNLSEFAGELPKALRKTFEINEVTFKTTLADARRPSENQAYADSLRRLSNKHAVCDNRWPSNIQSLFFSESIKSAALIPMMAKPSGDILGVLALGSNDPEHYSNELGTAHLDRLGVMAGVCLARLQPNTE